MIAKVSDTRTRTGKNKSNSNQYFVSASCSYGFPLQFEGSSETHVSLIFGFHVLPGVVQMWYFVVGG